MAFPKPDDLRADTIRNAKKLFEAIDDAPSGFKTDTRKEVAEHLGVGDKAFRWKKVVRPKFKDLGEDWPYYADPKTAANRLQSEYGKDKPEEEYLEFSKKDLVEILGVHQTTIWRAVRDDRSCKGFPVNEWAVTDGDGDIRKFRVPIDADAIENDSGDSSPVRQSSGDPASNSSGIVTDSSGVTDAKASMSEENAEEETDDRYDAWQQDLAAVDRGEDPDPSELTDRERYIATKLQKGHTIEGLVDDLSTRPSVLKQHLTDLKRQGWSLYIDSSAETVAIEGDNVLRSSEHKGTRTRKANRWWEMRHNELVRNFRGLEAPSAKLDATPGREDWVTHLTDLHAGDEVRREDGTVIYETEEIPDVVDYITEQSLSLAERHNAQYDDAHILWGGDMITGEAIYRGQFEDLDAWLDEQVEILIDPLIRQLKAFDESDMFGTTNVVCVVGNHGQNRANGTSRQANADLILYKFIRNAVAELNQHAGILDDVEFKIGQAEAFRNFDMRGGKLRGHLRHGQHRKPQAETSARKKEWQATYIDHDFDVAYMGHYHVTGRIPWNGPPILSTGSPKPAGEFVERIGAYDPEGDYQNVATVHGVSDEGLTSVYPVDTRNYS
jgi:hypothetical protein